MAELLPEETSSVFQIVQEDVLEWEAVEGESTVFKPQETEEIQPAEESSKPSEDGHPESDLKAPKRVSLKVKTKQNKTFMLEIVIPAKTKACGGRGFTLKSSLRS
jgi:hypothetical protein